jgi:hypothetical protein
MPSIARIRFFDGEVAEAQSSGRNAAGPGKDAIVNMGAGVGRRSRSYMVRFR